jgi:hypothetical protein
VGEGSFDAEKMFHRWDERRQNGRPMSSIPAQVPAEAASVVEFWKAAGPKAWFAKDDDFDRRFRERFAGLYEQAARGELDSWMDSAESALALILLLDQYARSIPPQFIPRHAAHVRNGPAGG